jgi:hypothetical protein
MSTEHDVTPSDQPAGQSARRNPRRILLGVLIVVVVAVAAVIASGALGRHEGQAEGQSLVSQLVPISVTYEITTSAYGGATADLTYVTASGITQQNGVHIGHSGTGGGEISVAVPSGTFVSISAQLSAADDSGAQDISCVIMSGAASVAQNDASGPYAITTCQGTAE